MSSLVFNRATNFLPPSRNINIQLQSNQFVLPTQLQNSYDTFNIYPSVQAASTESMSNLKAEMGQSTSNQPYRMNNDSLYTTLRDDRKSLDTMRANMTQNPFNVLPRDKPVPEYLFTGGYENELIFVDDENRLFLQEEKLTKGTALKMATYKKDKLKKFPKNRDVPNLDQMMPNIKIGLNIQSPMLGIRGENNSNNSNGANPSYYLESSNITLKPMKINKEFSRMKI